MFNSASYSATRKVTLSGSSQLSDQENSNPLAVFDAADGFSACTRRLRSNTPLQALTLLNDQQFFEFAGGLADRVRREAPAADLPARIDFAFRCCLARAPTAFETEPSGAVATTVASRDP